MLWLLTELWETTAEEANTRNTDFLSVACVLKLQYQEPSGYLILCYDLEKENKVIFLKRQIHV